MKLEIKGGNELLARLKRNADFKDVKNAVKVNGAELHRNMQSRASVDTGFMKRSIEIDIQNGGLTVVVRPTADYSAYVNFGTRFMTANPFVTSSYFMQKQKFIQDMKRLIN